MIGYQVQRFSSFFCTFLIGERMSELGFIGFEHG
jgi:hypothetical protein